MEKSFHKFLRVYIHIPFCVRKCRYCDFLSGPSDECTRQRYLDRLSEEMENYRELLAQRVITSVFIGGGTPSILEGSQIMRIMEELRCLGNLASDAEITIESNPGTLTEEKLKACRRAGINRLSIGLQSADDRELKHLGRIHTWEEFKENYGLARACGFTNINVDLMSALPGQTRESWRRTLEKVLALEPEHISAYSLIIEEGTPFFELYDAHPELLPGEEEERQMYYDTGRILKQYGYERYEISNYAKPGFECSHNLAYWEREDYLGIGLGAASLLGNRRRNNQTSLEAYLKGDFAGTEEVLTPQAVMEEHFFLGLRKMDGAEVAPYEGQYRKVIEKLVSEGLLEREGGKIRLTETGIDVSNYVMAEFLVE
ncbi:MAG: radical SAM family heme chaperone HemW [Lachnospiraceae bacterium]